MLVFLFKKAVSFPRLFPRFDVATPLFRSFQGSNHSPARPLKKTSVVAGKPPDQHGPLPYLARRDINNNQGGLKNSASMRLRRVTGESARENLFSFGCITAMEKVLRADVVNHGA